MGREYLVRVDLWVWVSGRVWTCGRVGVRACRRVGVWALVCGQ